MDKSLFRYIWQHSKREQLIVCAVVLLSQPFYFMSLDLPRRIVNEAIQGTAFVDGRSVARFLDITVELPALLGGQRLTLYDGFEVGRLGLLLGLSLVFLAFVIINGGFKYWINVAKGALGERMLRRMRFELFAMVLRFTPQAQRTVKASETATIVKDEVDPIGGFIGDAFITPVFLGTQALTALVFIMIQNIWLGLMAMVVIGAQFVIIPRLRRDLLRLGRMRQLESRRLAGRVAEVFDGLEAVHVHNTSAWERAEIGNRLYQLFDIRFQIYKRKFIVKFLNNFLSQLTPFLFYSVGGFFALRGTLDIGQLVAVIAAYRELPPPLKELIDWDQQRLDVQVKYDQVVQHFSPDRLLNGQQATDVDVDEDVALGNPLVAEDLRVMDTHGTPILDGVSFQLELPVQAAIVSDGTAAASELARILAGRTMQFGGRLTIGGNDLVSLPEAIVGRRVSYAGIDPILFPGTVRDNLVYGLRHRPIAKAELPAKEAARRIAEAKRTGNPLDSIADRWVDCESIGVGDENELDHRLLDLLHRVGLQDDIYRFGLSGMVDPDRHRELAERLVEARARLREVFRTSGMEDLVEPFDPDRYNDQATVAENILFGVPTRRELTGRNLAGHQGVRDVLDRADLVGPLTAMGLRIAETMTEIFRGLPPGHSLFEQFSFIGADELQDFENIVRRHSKGRKLPKSDEERLLALPLGYVESRHRLGLLDDDLRQRLVSVRRPIRAMLEQHGDPGVEFYDADAVCAAAPLRDNLLFGRVNYRAANAQTRVAEAVSAVVAELGLREPIERIGLNHQVGPAGRLLTAQQRASINLVRCLVKRPEIMVVDGALAPFDETRAERWVRFLIDICEKGSLFVVVPNSARAEPFMVRLSCESGKVNVVARRDTRDRPEASALAAE
jgi:putative ABC transport system ATP-binding protein